MSDHHAAAATRASATQRPARALEMPRAVIRGESLTEKIQKEENKKEINSEIAHVDWLGFSIRPGGDFAPLLEPFLEKIFGIQPSEWKPSARGWSGYKHTIELGPLGFIAYGGEQQRGTVNVQLNAHACARVKDWDALRVWCEEHQASITRIDLAHDDLTGATVNIPTVCRWYDDGGFTSNGRPPLPHLEDDYGSGTGKTFSVGKRGNGKYARCYEKGKQMGDPKDPWFRIEIELHNKSRVIPLEIIANPSPYFAGAYPCLAKLGSTPARIKTVKKTAQMDYARMKEWVKSAAGPALHVMAEAHGGDAAAVLADVIRKKIPKRLKGYQASVRQGLEEGAV